MQLEARLLASEYNGYRLLTMQARGEDPGLAGMVMKLFSTQLGYDISKTAMDVLGDRGALARGELNAPDMGMFALLRTCGRSASSSPAARPTSSATSSPSAGSACRSDRGRGEALEATLRRRPFA